MLPNNYRLLSLSIATLVIASAVIAQPPTANVESLERWSSYIDVQAPGDTKGNVLSLVIPPRVFDDARNDLADLRVRDSHGAEVPFALRIRRAVDQREPLAAKTFNSTTNPDRSVEISLDLGNDPVQHNEIEINTGESNYRRKARVETSDDGKSWSPLLDSVEMLHFQVKNQTVDQRRFTYPSNRRRYLRVTVYPDAGLGQDKPNVPTVTVFHSVFVPGQYVKLPARLGSREAVRADGNPGSAWEIDLESAGPCERLFVNVLDQDFVRNYRLETAEVGALGQYLTGGEWRRRPSADNKALIISLNNEVFARRLRLVVTDYRNPPLTITDVSYEAAARELLIPATANIDGRFRLYFGNPQAEAPRYDFAQNLPANPQTSSLLADVKTEKNPDYRPAPKPWTDRWPWLIYVVLGAASVILLLILASIARQAGLTNPAVPATPDASTAS